MNRIASLVLVVLGIALIAFGLFFLVGSAGRAYRIGISVLSLALGGVCVGLGIRWFKAENRKLPAFIRAEVLELVRRRSGEISQPDLMALLAKRWTLALEPLQGLMAEGLCEKRVVDGVDYYVFAAMQPRISLRRCEFCDAELPLDASVSSCPNCGGTIKTGVEAVSLSKDEAYSMDE